MVTIIMSFPQPLLTQELPFYYIDGTYQIPTVAHQIRHIQAQGALHLLAESVSERINSLQQQSSNHNDDDSDYDMENESPIIDRFLEHGGSEAMLTVMNFNHL